MDISENKIRLAFFDIGKCNFAFYIEEIDLQDLLDIDPIPKTEMYNCDGTPTLKFANVLNKIYKNGKSILMRNINITPGTDKSKYFDIELCYNMVDVLNEYQDYWCDVDYVVVERQMSFGRKINTMALKLGQHCQSYFINNYGRDIKVVEFEAYHKTVVLGAEKDRKSTKTGKVTYKPIGDKERKKWAVEQAFSILAIREDYDTMSEISLMKKKDDVCDNICMAQAFKYLQFVDK